MIIGLLGCMGSGKDTVARILQYYTLPPTIRTISVEEWVSNEFTYREDIINTLSTYRQSNGAEYSFTVYLENKKFAKKVKEFASILLNEPLDRFEDREFKNSYLPILWSKYLNDRFNVELDQPITVRQFLQYIANELRDNFNEAVWAIGLFKDFDSTSNWVISDVRYFNEIEFIKYYDVESRNLINIEYADRFIIWIYNDNQSKDTVCENTHQSENLASNAHKLGDSVIDFKIVNNKDLGVKVLADDIYRLLKDNKETIGKYFYV